MFNKSYHLRAVRQAGGGHKVAAKALLRLPEPWRPLVTVAAAAEEAFYRPKRRVRPGKPGYNRIKTTQLELFPENPHPSKERLSGPPRDFERPLFDLFPEAYQNETRS